MTRIVALKYLRSGGSRQQSSEKRFTQHLCYDVGDARKGLKSSPHSSAVNVSWAQLVTSSSRRPFHSLPWLYMLHKKRPAVTSREKESTWRGTPFGRRYSISLASGEGKVSGQCH